MDHLTDYIKLLSNKSNDQLLAIVEQLNAAFVCFEKSGTTVPFNMHQSRDIIKLVLDDRNLVQ